MKIVLLLFIFGLMASTPPVKHTVTPPDNKLIAKGRLPNMATDDAGNVHIVYGSGDSILYLSSFNKGTTFSNPQLVAVLPKVFANAMRGPQIAVTSTGVTIIANTDYGNIYSYHKGSSGTWTDAIKVNDVDSVSREALTSLSADGNRVFAVWLDVRANGGKGQRLFGARSEDGGLSWTKNIMIYASPDKTICECCKPSVLVKGNQVYAMFRNWIDGNRDLYLVASQNNGQDFGKATKLGQGSWKLNGCPMDGGGMALDNHGKIATVWRREGNIYATTERAPEVLLGAGRSCAMESVNGKNLYTWTRDGVVIVATTDTVITTLGKGSIPILKRLDDDHVICVWEHEGQVETSVIAI